tara:strand:- start:198 stop:2111 length:1914 start_codon:yes stop_codon:yes gene_type:complete
MCGISGIIKNHITEKDIDNVIKMNQILSHRGPDSKNIETHKNFVFGHTRLAIIDLSEKGVQPMKSKDERYIIVYNGEIYNHNKLKEKLILENNFYCLGHSDTEIFLNCLQVWGLKKTLSLIYGMFAFALYDYKRNKFYLVRDKIGEKPLYYTKQNDEIIFSSELQPICNLNGFSKKLNSSQLNNYFKYNYIPSPYTIFENVYKLNPGSLIEIDGNNLKFKHEKYFDIKKTLNDENKKLKYNEILNLSDNLIDLVINEQSISDVKLGSFLSGGIDSSLVTAYLQKNSIKKVSTFNVSYNDINYDESKYAKEISNILGTDHYTLDVDDKIIENNIHNLPNIYGEPFADSSQILTFLVSKLAKTKVKVCLSGDGGDEIFGGYNRHKFIKKYLPILNKVSIKNKKRLKFIFNKIPISFLQKVDKFENKKFVNFSNKFDKFIRNLDYENLEDFYKSITSNINSNSILNKEIEVNNFLFKENEIFSFDNVSNLKKALIIDQSNYLSDDIFTKVDRSSMTNSLEVRCPLADIRLAENLNSINDEYKISSNTKVILRQLLKKFLPIKLIDRPKMGFGFPLNKLIKKNLKDLTFQYLSINKLKNSGIFNEKKILNLVEDHMKNYQDNSQLIWSIIIFQIWYEKNFS